MEYTELGNTGEKIPVMGMGSWELGNDRKRSVDALKHGLGLGIRFIDTAEIYGTESIVGDAIKGQGDLFIATKVWPTHFDREGVVRACNNSLKNLGVKTIDLYQLHWPSYNVPIRETMSAMEELQKQGKIRHIGVSNFSAGEVDAARGALKNSEIVSNQIEYSLTVRDPEKEFLGYAKRNKITVIAYSPLGHGALFDERNRGLIEFLGEMGKKYRKTAVQVALGWLMSKDQVVAIPKASGVEHIDENFGAVGINLSAEDIGEIDRKSKEFEQPPLAASFRKRNADLLGNPANGLKIWPETAY